MNMKMELELEMDMEMAMEMKRREIWINENGNHTESKYIDFPEKKDTEKDGDQSLTRYM